MSQTKQEIYHSQPPSPKPQTLAETYGQVYDENYEAAVGLNLYSEAEPPEISRRVIDITNWLIGC